MLVANAISLPPRMTQIVGANPFQYITLGLPREGEDYSGLYALCEINPRTNPIYALATCAGGVHVVLATETVHQIKNVFADCEVNVLGGSNIDIDQRFITFGTVPPGSIRFDTRQEITRAILKAEYPNYLIAK